MKRTGRPSLSGSGITPQRRFRLSDQTMAQLAFLADALVLDTTSAALRDVVDDLARQWGWTPDWEIPEKFRKSS